MKRKNKRGICVLLLALMVMGSACQNKSEACVRQESKTVVGADFQTGQGVPSSKFTVQAEPNTKPTPYQTYGKLSVKGTQLLDEKKNPIQLKGVSIFFLQYANIDAFRTMRDEWGIHMVRLPLYTAGYDGYCTNDENRRAELKKKIYDGIDAASELGLYVIVDWHVLHEGDPNVYRKEAMDFFRETVSRYAGYDNILYEICNEPNGGVSWKTVKSYAEQLIPVIREKKEDAVIIVGTPTWSQDVDQAAADPIIGSNLMYALHFYAETHREALRQKTAYAIEHGLPVFVSEFGISDASGNGKLNKEEAQKWMDLINQYGLSYSIWSLSNKNESSALLLPSVTALSGWAYDDLTESGKWFLDMLGAAPSALGKPDAKEPVKQAEETAERKAEKQVAASKGQTLQADVRLVNSWDSNGKQYRHYTVELKNTGKTQIDTWNCKITFDKNVKVSQSWCGAFSVKGSCLTITPETYNAVLNAGASVTNVGFILEMDAGTEITSVSCQ